MTAGLPTIPMKNPGFTAPGLKEVTYEDVVDLGTAAANFDIKFKIPRNAIVVAVALSVPFTISATTATKIGIGRKTASADPDKYGLTAALTATELVRIHNGWGSPISDSGGESLAIYACDNAGDAAGSIGGTGQYVVASITAFIPQPVYS